MTAKRMSREEADALERTLAAELAEPPRVVCWEAIVCRGCGRRLFDDDGSKLRSWRRWIGC